MGQLIGVAAALYHQQLVDQRHSMIHRHAQPEIVILAHRKSFVEAADLLKQFVREHHRRGAHQTEFQARNENIPRRFAMSDLRIDPNAVTNSDFLGLANLYLRVLLHERSLDRQFVR